MRTRDIRIGIVATPGERGASAFTISFSYSEPHKAQQVVQALMTKFQEVNETTQRDAQTSLTAFVGDELTTSKATLSKLDEELTKFRIEHPGQLPEQEQLNLGYLNSLQEQLRSVSDSMSRLAQDRVELDTHLETLKNQTQLLDMLDREPDLATPVVRQQNERLALLNKEVADGETTLAQLRQVERENYPDVQLLVKRLAVVRKQRDDLQKQQEDEDAKPKAAAVAKPKVTTFRQAESASALKANIDQTNGKLQTLDMRRTDLQKQLDFINKQIVTYQSRLDAESRIEAQYNELLRSQKQAAETYQANQATEQLAEKNNQLLQRRAGEQLLVLDNATLPTQPFKPNRWMIVGAGVGIAFVLGLALAGVQEARDTSLKNLKDVRAYTNLPVLSSIPLLENTMLVRRKRRLAYLAWSAGVIIGMLAITASLYYHTTQS